MEPSKKKPDVGKMSDKEAEARLSSIIESARQIEVHISNLRVDLAELMYGENDYAIRTLEW